MVFIFVFTLVVGASIIITSLSPKAYLGKARIKLEYKEANGKSTRAERRTYDPILAGTETRIINSEAILNQVIGELNLNAAWGKKYFSDETLKTWESLAILRNRIDIHPLPGTTLIEVKAFDDNPGDAAKIANTVVKVYADYAATNADEPQVEIVDSAYAYNAPVRPNKALNLTIGIFAGILLGVIAGTGIALFVFLKDRKSLRTPEI